MLGLPPPESNTNPDFYVFFLVHATWVTVTFKNLSRSRVPEKMDYHKVCTGAWQECSYLLVIAYWATFYYSICGMWWCDWGVRVTRDYVLLPNQQRSAAEGIRHRNEVVQLHNLSLSPLVHHTFRIQYVYCSRSSSMTHASEIAKLQPKWYEAWK